jgi:hypothetical protein
MYPGTSDQHDAEGARYALALVSASSGAKAGQVRDCRDLFTISYVAIDWVTHGVLGDTKTGDK